MRNIVIPQIVHLKRKINKVIMDIRFDCHQNE